LHVVTGYGDHLAGGGVPSVGELGGDELVDESGEHQDEDEPDERHENLPDPQPQPAAPRSGP
jgi:hypothetical protein